MANMGNDKIISELIPYLLSKLKKIIIRNNGIGRR
jgi:hypothetical protein